MAVLVQHKTVDIPDSDGATAVIRKLKGRHLRSAQMAKQAEMVDAFEAWSKIQARMKAAIGSPDTPDAPEDDAPAEPAAEPDPMDAYDHATLCRYGVVSLTGVPELTADVFEDMDDDKLESLAREILRFTKPSLFQSKDEREADRKNA